MGPLVLLDEADNAKSPHVAMAGTRKWMEADMEVVCVGKADKNSEEDS
jgi:hypothetical protein